MKPCSFKQGFVFLNYIALFRLFHVDWSAAEWRHLKNTQRFFDSVTLRSKWNDVKTYYDYIIP